MKKICLIAISLLFCGLSANAEEDIFGNDVTSFLDEPTIEKAQVKPQAPALSSFLSSHLPSATLYNIEHAEKVFCYTVDYAEPNFNGYTIDGLAVKGSCGELSNEGISVIKTALLENNSVYSNSVEQCNISPRLMLRYIYGLDYTDILLSAPCHSLTFFHGRDITTINAAPGAEIVNTVIQAYGKLEEKFLSPALLGQMVANGQALNQNQKEIVRRMSPTETPRRKWSNSAVETQSPNSKVDAAKPAKSGWNKLK